ncbi:AraC family transcriptional regulator [Enterobacterales bacterium CwR94]|nr:AraC family transcriptional regulator [Enterobacterales bacterium CwR94]
MSFRVTDWFDAGGVECSRMVVRQDRFPRHTHDEYVLCANLSGVEHIWLDGRELTAHAGDITLYNPGSVQGSSFGDDAVEFISLHIPQPLIAALAAGNTLSDGRSPPVLQEGVFRHPALFHAICRFAQCPTARAEEQQRILRLCRTLLREPPHNSEVSPHLHDVQCWMRSHLTEKPALEQLASVGGISKFHFTRQFSQQTGIPPLQYHMQLRLQAARALLRQQVPPLDAALQLGFYDQSHFINAFRKVMGITPQRYWRQIHGNLRSSHTVQSS